MSLLYKDISLKREGRDQMEDFKEDMKVEKGGGGEREGVVGEG